MSLPVYRDECRHFTGILNEKCAAGIVYRDVGVGSKSKVDGIAAHVIGVGCLPCYDDGQPVPDTCTARVFMTQQDLEDRKRERDARLVEVFDRLAKGLCPHCGATIEPSTVVGACQYGACGHRIGQVGRGRKGGAR